jgi:hypothetical protein
VKPAAPADRIEKAVRGGASTAAGSHEKMPNAVAQMVQQGTWQGGETVAAAPTTVLKKGPPLYTAADAKKDVAAMASANAAITAAEKVNAPDTVVHAKTSSKSVMQVPCRCCASISASFLRLPRVICCNGSIILSLTHSRYLSRA